MSAVAQHSAIAHLAQIRQKASGYDQSVPLGLRPLIVIAAGVACLVLAFVVLLGHPANQLDLLAWMGVATGVALIVLVTPFESHR